jgi:hypothetical protein
MKFWVFLASESRCPVCPSVSNLLRPATIYPFSARAGHDGCLDDNNLGMLGGL